MDASADSICNRSTNFSALAVFLVTVWLLHVRPGEGGARQAGLFAAAIIFTLLSPFSPWPVLTIGVVLTALVTLTMRRSDSAA